MKKMIAPVLLLAMIAVGIYMMYLKDTVNVTVSVQLKDNTSPSQHISLYGTTVGKGRFDLRDYTAYSSGGILVADFQIPENTDFNIGVFEENLDHSTLKNVESIRINGIDTKSYSTVRNGPSPDKDLWPVKCFRAQREADGTVTIRGSDECTDQLYQVEITATGNSIP